MTGVALLIGMDRSLRGHEILLDDINGTKKTWIQVVRKKVILDNTPLVILWEYSKVKLEKGMN